MVTKIVKEGQFDLNRFDANDERTHWAKPWTVPSFGSTRRLRADNPGRTFLGWYGPQDDYR